MNSRTKPNHKFGSV